MRRLLYSLALTLFLSAISILGQTEKRLPGTTGAVGPVKTIRIERATFTKQNGAAVEGPRVLERTFDINEDGTKQESVVYATTGQVVQRSVETYEPDGRVTEAKFFRGNGALARRVVTLYDDQKRRTEMVVYGPDDAVVSRTTFRQTDNKLEMEGVAYDARGAIINQSKSSTDLKTRQMETTSVTPTGVIQTQSSSTKQPDGSQEYRREGSNGEFERLTTKGDGPGALNQVIYNRDGTIKSRERLLHEYDAHHNIIKTVHLSAQGDAGEFEPVEVTYRTFTYYEKRQ
jgi:hypothetical protein